MTTHLGIEVADESLNNSKVEKQFLAQEPTPFKAIRKQLERKDAKSKKKQGKMVVCMLSPYLR